MENEIIGGGEQQCDLISLLTKIRGMHRAACCLLHAGFLLGLFFDHEDGGDMFPRESRLTSADYTALYPGI
jgi:hypothetical protein